MVSMTCPSVNAGGVALTGDGPRFCAGGTCVPCTLLARMAGDYVFELADAMDRALQTLSDAPKPVVVGVQGVAAGAGLAAMLAGDLVVSAPDTSFVAAYTRLGLVPDCGLSWLLPRAIGQLRALEMVLTNRRLSATEALGVGLVTSIVEGDAAETALETAKQFADGPSLAYGLTRQLMRGSWSRTRAESGADEARNIAGAVVTDEATTLIQTLLGH